MTPRQTPGEEENSTYQNPKLKSHHICNIYVLKADQVTPISNAPVNCLDQADAAGSASHVERWDPDPSDCPPNVSVSETGHLYVMLLLRGWWHVAKQLYLDTLLSTHTLSCHCSNLNFILPLIVSEVYIGNRTVRDELKEARRWYDCPLRSDMAVHVVECVIFQLCGSLFHNINCPPPPNLCHGCCLYDDKFSAVVTLVALSEDWWSSEAGNPSPLRRDFRNLFLITPHGRGCAVMTPSQHDTTGNRYRALKVNVLLENYLSSDKCRGCLRMRQSTDGSTSFSSQS